MKCPKCKYVTFDYLDTCPRCGKNMSSEKAKLNISGIKANPPSVLGSLTGDIGESAEELAMTDEMGFEGEEVYDDGSDLDIKIDEEPLSGSGDVTDVDIGDLGLGDEDKGSEVDFVADAEEPSKTRGKKKEPEDIDLELEDVELDLDFGDEEGPNK
jgi:hypothetical protein